MKVQALVSPFDVRPITISFEQDSRFPEVYGFVGRRGRVYLEGQLFVPRGRAARSTLLLFMHPSSALNLLPLPRALAGAGHHVMCCGSRYLRNDAALIMENVAQDLGAYVRYAREGLGYRRVVLVGWSGGGSLAVFYQAQAERPTLERTPAGDPVDLSGLPAADALLLVAAHLSRAETLTEWMDPSVIDERDPELRDAELDLYGGKVSPPYSAAFLARYRDAQRARNRRITDACYEQLARLERLSNGEVERAFVIQRTMADPRWLDPGVDPNDRKPGVCYQGGPRVANTGPTGLARFTTLRSFLSQWSYEASHATSWRNCPNVSVPVLVVENGADDATPASHPARSFELLGTSDKSYVRIDGATHYYQGQPEHERRALAACGEWLASRGLDG